jgi:hypothetical protein
MGFLVQAEPSHSSCGLGDFVALAMWDNWELPQSDIGTPLMRQVGSM